MSWHSDDECYFLMIGRIGHSALKLMPIDPAFDFVRDYPADWNARREFVRERDQGYCQVTGCLNTISNTLRMDVHHIDPINRNPNLPDHRVGNLVLLCRFHHAMLPDHGRMEERNDRYHLVSPYWRCLPGQSERTFVKGHVSRHAQGRITDLDIKSLFEKFEERYAIECKHCHARDWKIKIQTHVDRVLIYCMGCWRAWLYERCLREEIGIQLFQSALQARKNEGRFFLSMDNLCVRKPVEPIICEDCRAVDRPLSILEKRQNQQSNQYFLGCESWRTTQCQFTRNWHEADESHLW